MLSSEWQEAITNKFEFGECVGQPEVGSIQSQRLKVQSTFIGFRFHS